MSDLVFYNVVLRGSDGRHVDIGIGARSAVEALLACGYLTWAKENGVDEHVAHNAGVAVDEALAIFAERHTPQMEGN